MFRDRPAKFNWYSTQRPKASTPEEPPLIFMFKQRSSTSPSFSLYFSRQATTSCLFWLFAVQAAMNFTVYLFVYFSAVLVAASNSCSLVIDTAGSVVSRDS